MAQRVVLLLAFVGGLLSAGVAQAQIRWGREAVPRSGVCFYDDADYRGQYFCVAPGERLASLPRGMGDRISSIRVFGDADVTVFRDRSFRGASTRFGRDVVNLKREGWNDSISSIVIGRERGVRDDRGVREERRDERERPWAPVWGHEALPREGACFYENRDFRGRYFCAPRGTTLASMPPGFNDKISSIRVFGGGVSLFRDNDFRGRSSRISRDVPNLGSAWGDRISSLRVF